jgi:hypothetical protein
MTRTRRSLARVAVVAVVLTVVAGAVAGPAFAEEPAPTPEPTTAPTPVDPSPDPAPPRTASKPKPAVSRAPVRASSLPRRAQPSATTVTRRPPTSSPSSSRRSAPARPRTRQHQRPIRAAVPRPSAHVPPRARPRRELPAGSVATTAHVVRAARGGPPSGDELADAARPAAFLLAAALLAAFAAAVGSMAAPSIRLAVPGGHAGERIRLAREPVPRPGRSERRHTRRAQAKRSTPPRHTPPLPPRPAASVESSTCEIEWFRGYVKSQFYVLLDAPAEGSWRRIASPWFAWRQAEPPPPLPEIVAARDKLLAKLEGDGWKACGRGRAWYSQRLTPRDGA